MLVCQPAILLDQRDPGPSTTQYQPIPDGECSMDSTASVCSARAQQEELGLLDLAQIAPVLDFRAPNAPSNADLDLCRDFLAASLPPPREALDALTQIVSSFFLSLPNQRGRFCEALLALPGLDLLADALRLESAVLDAFTTYCSVLPVQNFLSIDVTALASLFPVQDVVGSLMLQRPAAFDMRMLILDRTSTLFLLVIHMVTSLVFVFCINSISP